MSKTDNVSSGNTAADVDSENEDLPALVQHPTTPLQRPQRPPTTPESAKEKETVATSSPSKKSDPKSEPTSANKTNACKQSALVDQKPTSQQAQDTSLEKDSESDEKKKAASKASLEESIRAQVAALAQEKGDAGVQQMLQRQIQITKKKESEIATAKKRVDQASAELDAKQLAYKKLVQKKTSLEMSIQELESDMQRQDDQVSRALREMENNRENIREKVQRDVDELHAKMKAMAETDIPLEDENVVLRQECAALKSEFDAAFAAYESDWKQREADSSSLVQSLQEVLGATELLEATLLLRKREATALADATKSFQMQCEAFEERAVAFEEVAVKSEDIERTTSTQKARLQQRIHEYEEEKKTAHEKRIQSEKETLALKGSIAAAKKKLLLVEKQKMALEQKVRKAQGH